MPFPSASHLQGYHFQNKSWNNNITALTTTKKVSSLIHISPHQLLCVSYHISKDEISKANLTGDGYANIDIFFTFTELFPLVITQMVRTEEHQHTPAIYIYDHTSLVTLQDTRKETLNIEGYIRHKKSQYYTQSHTTNLTSLCLGKRVFLKYCGVSRYFKIRTKKGASVSLLSERFVTCEESSNYSDFWAY